MIASLLFSNILQCVFCYCEDIDLNLAEKAGLHSVQENKMTAEKTGDHCAAPDCYVVTDSACAVNRMEAVFGSLVTLSEPQPDVIIEVKLVCCCLCHCSPKYSLSSHGNLRTPSKSLCIHSALVHWALTLDGTFRAHDQAHLLTDEDTEARGGDLQSSLPSRTRTGGHIACTSPSPSVPLQQPLPLVKGIEPLPLILVANHQFCSFLFPRPSLPQVICKMNLVCKIGTHWKSKGKIEPSG